MWVVIPFFSRKYWQMLCLFSTEGQAVKAERPKNQNRIIEYGSLTKVTVLGASSINRSEATNNFQLSTFNFQLKNLNSQLSTLNLTTSHS